MLFLVYGEAAGSRSCEIQEDKAEQDGSIAAILGGKGTAGKMRHEIGDGHFARGDEGGAAAVKTQRNECTGDQLYDPARAREGGDCGVHGPRREVQKLGSAVLQKCKACDDAGNAKDLRRIPTQEIHSQSSQLSCGRTLAEIRLAR